MTNTEVAQKMLEQVTSMQESLDKLKARLEAGEFAQAETYSFYLQWNAELMTSELKRRNGRS